MTHESWVALGSICLVNGHLDRRSSHNQTYHWNKESCFHIFLLQCHYWELCQQFILPVHTKEELKAQILKKLQAVTNSSWALNDSMWEIIIGIINFVIMEKKMQSSQSKSGINEKYIYCCIRKASFDDTIHIIWNSHLYSMMLFKTLTKLILYIFFLLTLIIMLIDIRYAL